MSVHTLHWLNLLDLVTVIDEPIHRKLDKISLLPYTEDKAVMKQFFKDVAKNGEGISCFMHQGISNVPMGSGFLINEILTLDMIPDEIKHVYTGHYHKHTKVSDNATIIGSTMQLNWSDEGDTKGFLIVDTETGKIEQIESNAPRFVTYDMITALRPDRKRSVLVEGNFVRVTSYEDRFKDDIREELTGAGARSVEFVAHQVDVKRLQTPCGDDEFHLPSLVADYIKQQDVSEDRSKIGKEIMGVIK
ncbi:hypothetical protein LCGC14_2976870, partial [marine sediment metagenome]